ncbi:4Fe-4S dicluster domain-containing protein [Desulfotomaculum defluvii]
MTNKMIIVDHHKCVGCCTCEMICSLVHEGICLPELSRIKVNRYEKSGKHVPITCANCENAPCMEACPVEAIVKNEVTGGLEIQENQCIGCQQCVEACPFDHIKFNDEKGNVFKCDLCQGDPQCVKYCWTQAISFS